jgi:hypothetical protein
MEAALVTGLIAARVGQVQLAIAAKMLKMNADAARSAVQLVDAAQQNMDRLTQAALGLGRNLDVSV